LEFRRRRWEHDSLLGPQVPTPIYTTGEEASLAGGFHANRPSV
jgi:hypothetical protein